MKRTVILALALVALLSTGCAGHRGINTVISLEPKVASGLRNFQLTVEQQKPGLQAVNCGQDAQTPPQSVNCYVAIQTVIGKLSSLNVMLTDATAALNTTSANTAIQNMIDAIEGWLNNQQLKLPPNFQPFVIVGMEGVRTVLLVMQGSLT